MMGKREVNKSVVIGTIGMDAHMIGGWVLAKAFEDAGFKVAFLGAVVPHKEFIDAAIEVDADAILVSSMYGMGLLDCEGFRDKCIEAGLNDIILYVGGTVAAPM
jgi:methylaspartate mutase sigma subunit